MCLNPTGSGESHGTRNPVIWSRLTSAHLRIRNAHHITPVIESAAFRSEFRTYGSGFTPSLHRVLSSDMTVGNQNIEQATTQTLTVQD